MPGYAGLVLLWSSAEAQWRLSRFGSLRRGAWMAWTLRLRCIHSPMTRLWRGWHLLRHLWHLWHLWHFKEVGKFLVLRGKWQWNGPFHRLHRLLRQLHLPVGSQLCTGHARGARRAQDGRTSRPRQREECQSLPSIFATKLTLRFNQAQAHEICPKVEFPFPQIHSLYCSWFGLFCSPALKVFLHHSSLLVLNIFTYLHITNKYIQI